MKTTRFQRLHRIVLFVTIIGMISCIGCSDIIDDIFKDIGEPPATNEPSNGDGDVVDDSWIIANMPITEIGLIIAESFPVQVSVVVTGYLADSCTEHHETHQTREGNTVTVQMTTKRPKDLFCAAIVTEVQMLVPIGTFLPGDYKVIVNGMEQEFRVD
jgi:inhibitor of cysteine peptidase